MAAWSRRLVDEVGSLPELAADPLHVMRDHRADVRRLGVKPAAGQRPAPASSRSDRSESVWTAPSDRPRPTPPKSPER